MSKEAGVYGILIGGTCLFAVICGISFYHLIVYGGKYNFTATLSSGLLFLLLLFVTLYCRFKKEKNNENKK